MVHGNGKINQTYLGTLVVPLVYYKTHNGIEIEFITYTYYIKQAKREPNRRLHRGSIYWK
jgi:hypothetical protein